MKIVAISDTHMGHEQLKMPAGDVLVHAGDGTFVGNEPQIRNFNKWLGTLPYKHKIFVAGNHDWMFEQHPAHARKLLTNATYLQDSGVEIDGIKFWGSPWQPAYNSWAFNLWHDHQLADKWRLIPDGIDVLVTHTPPYGVLDQMKGCKMLDLRVREVKPRVHIFGHLHGGHGSLVSDGTEFYNVSSMNDVYDVVNRPVEIEINRVA